MTVPKTHESGHITGQRLRLAREWAGLTMKKAATLYGCTVRRLQKLEKEGVHRWPDQVQALAKMYGCRAEWLLGAQRTGTEHYWQQARIAAAQADPGLALMEKRLLRIDPPGEREEEGRG